MAIRNLLPVVLVAYAAASFFHHAHNAEFLEQYPNLPAWLSPAAVYAAWLTATAIGFAGYGLLRRGFAAHTPMMNLSIGLEAAAAAALLIVTFGVARARRRPVPN